VQLQTAKSINDKYIKNRDYKYTSHFQNSLNNHNINHFQFNKNQY